MRRWIVGLAAVVMLGGGEAYGSVHTYEIQRFSYQSSSPLTTAFAGTGYVGLHSDCFTPCWAYELNWSRTVIQVDISGLAGATLHSATLAYDVLNGRGGTGDARITSITTNGTVGHSFPAPPDDLGSIVFTAVALGHNEVDITPLVDARVQEGASWLGLYLAPEGVAHWTSVPDSDLDRAKVRLHVDYTPIPEPSTLAIWSLLSTLGIAVVWRRRRRAA